MVEPSEQLGILGHGGDLDAVGEGRPGLVGCYRAHLLDLAAGLGEAEPLRERERSPVVDHRADLVVAVLLGVERESPEQGGAEAVPAVRGQHARGHGAPAQVALRRAARAGQLAVAEREQHEAAAGTKLRDRGRPLVGQQRPAHVAPELELGVRLRDAQLDHPDRFSFPCRFA